MKMPKKADDKKVDDKNADNLTQQTTQQTLVSDQQIKQVKKLLTILQESDLEEVRLRVGNISLSIKRSPAVSIAPSALPATPLPAASTSSNAPAVQEAASNYTPIKSPMVGTFYAAANPESKPFVQVGDKVSVGQTICIIEAMKLFNNIEADVAGTVVEMLVENATAVEYEQPLFLIDPS